MSMDNVVKATFSLLKNIPSLCPVFSNISKEMGGLIMLANLTGGGGSLCREQFEVEVLWEEEAVFDYGFCTHWF